MVWKYFQPVVLYFGNDQLNELSEIIKEKGYQRGLLITTGHFIKNKKAQEMISAKQNHLIEVFTGFSPNPDVTEVDACAEVLRKNQIDFVVAMGGGSVIDGAKAAASCALQTESVTRYHGTGIPLPAGRLPLIAVPTTAGTGSEVTNVAVLTDRQEGKKLPVASDSFYPECAIVDPKLTWSMPPYLTACTGIDVLCHAIEGYWSKEHQPVCDVLAVHAAKLVFAHLRNAYRDGTDQTARERMAEASVMAGLAFGFPKTTASHACSFPLTNLYGIPHGEACAVTLDYFVRLNGKADARTRELAVLLGFCDSERLADEVFQLKKDLGLRTGLKDAGLTEQDIDRLAALSHHPNLQNNPVKMTDEILRDLYKYLKS